MVQVDVTSICVGREQRGLRRSRRLAHACAALVKRQEDLLASQDEDQLARRLTWITTIVPAGRAPSVGEPSRVGQASKSASPRAGTNARSAASPLAETGGGSCMSSSTGLSGGESTIELTQ